MKARIEPIWQRNAVAITLYRETPGGGAEVLTLADQPRRFDTWVPVVPNASPPVTLELQVDALEALVTAASDHLPPTAATDRHLADAIDVRDRVFGLLEHLAAPPKHIDLGDTP